MASRNAFHSRPSSRFRERHVIGGNSMARGATTVVRPVPPTTVGTSHDIAQRFAQQFADYSPAQIAQGAKVTKEAARLWLNAERCINLKDALELVRSEFPGAEAWLLSEMGLGERAGFNSPEEIHRRLALLEARLK